MKTDTPKRVQKMMDELEINQVEIGKLAGASKAMVNHWLTGKVESVAAEYAYNLEARAGYSARWIMLGDGPERVDKTVISVVKLMEGMTAQEREQLYRIGKTLGDSPS